MGLFDGKKDEKSAASSPSPVSPAVTPQGEKQKKEKAIPKNVEKHFTEEEKKLFSKSIKTMKPDEAKKYYEIKARIVKLQSRIIIRQLNEKANPKFSNKLLSYAKCIYAEEILTTEEGKRLLQELAGKKEFTANGANGLEALAKSHNLDLKFKVKPKAEKKDA